MIRRVLRFSILASLLAALVVFAAPAHAGASPQAIRPAPPSSDGAPTVLVGEQRGVGRAVITDRTIDRERAGTPETGATIDRDDGEADDPSAPVDGDEPADHPQQPTDDPDVHDPVEAARSDRSIGSWVLVGAALIAAAIGFGIVFNHTRERLR